MIENDELEERHAIPRWRSISGSTEQRELSSYGRSNVGWRDNLIFEAKTAIDADFSIKKDFWRNSGTLSSAEELLSVALMADRASDAAVLEAAVCVSTSESTQEGMRRFAQKIIHGVGENDQSALPLQEAKIRQEISRRKKWLKLNPRDALNLTETALLHANIGQLHSSRRLLEWALSIAPNDRYVLRSAARFFSHAGDPEAALFALRRSSRTRRDPWLSSAMLAVEAISKVPPTEWKQIKRLVDSGSFSDRDKSELAAQLGTLELSGGSQKRAMKWFRQSGADPTENTIAQVEWVGNKTKVFSPNEILSDLSLSEEADAHVAFNSGRWKHSISACEKWHIVEPFSARPAVFGSFVAAVSKQSLEAGIALAELGLLANPLDSSLINNLCVLHAYRGDLKKANTALLKLKGTSLDPDTELSILATEGLIEFRSGNIILGTEMYLNCIRKSIERSQPRTALRAYCFLAREVARHDVQMADAIARHIDETSEQFDKVGTSIPSDVRIIRRELEQNQANRTEVDWGKLNNFDQDDMFPTRLVT